nr:hypothetical protein [Clostridioides difficile]
MVINFLLNLDDITIKFLISNKGPNTINGITLISGRELVNPLAIKALLEAHIERKTDAKNIYKNA